MNIQLLFGRNLKKLRMDAKLSQMNLADATNLAHNFINDIEKGRKWVSAKTIEKFAKALKAEPFQFFIDMDKLSGQERDIVRFFLMDIIENLLKLIREYQDSYLPDGQKDKKGNCRRL